MRSFDLGVAGTPPESVRAYIETMLDELASMANGLGESELATAIEDAAGLARVARGKAALAGSADGEVQPLTSGRA